MSDSIFTKIIKGEIPCHKIYEDDKSFAFLDIRPVQPGHTLVIPKRQIDHLWDLPDKDYQAVMATCKKVALRMRKILGVARVGVKVMGEEVPHAHVQLIPFDTIGQYNSPPNLSVDERELAEMAQKLAF